METLRKSIEQVEEMSFACRSGRFDIYLDPEQKSIYVFRSSNDVPVNAYLKVDQRIATIYDKAIPSSVTRSLLEIEEDLEEVLSGYKSKEFEFNNFRGKWSEAALHRLEVLGERVGSGIAYYWDPGDWFSPVLGEAKALWDAGKSAEQILDILGCGNDVDGCVDWDEALQFMEEQITEWEFEM